jgi:hypothetical protein
VSYSWIIFYSKGGLGCSLAFYNSDGIISYNLDLKGGGTSVVGKRSRIKAVKRGISALTNLGMLLNFIALMRIESS